MENKTSLIKGTTWYWRKGHLRFPMHSSVHDTANFTTDELCLPFSDEEQGRLISQELADNDIHLSVKYVRSSSKNVQRGKKILYTRAPIQKIDDESDFEYKATNLKKLKEYIYQNGGIIQDEKIKFSIKKFNLFHFLTGGRK